MSGALFGSAAAGSRSSGKNLVEFRAGKMQLKGTTVTPDKRKGLLYVHQSDDSLMHFCWKDRGSGVVEDDLIIFPDDCEFKSVPQCTTGRVYILKFKSSSRKFFFWMQEPKKDKDDEHCKKVNEMLNNPPAPGSSGGGGRSGAGGLPPELAGLGASLGEGGLQNVLGNMDQQQLMQLLNSGSLGGMGGMGGLGGLGGLIGAGRPSSSQSSSSAAPSRAQSTPAVHAQETTSNSSQPRPATTTTQPQASTTSTVTPSTTTASTTATQQNPAIQLSDLQSILSTMNIPNPSGAAKAEAPAQQPVDLSKVLTSEAMAPILAKPELQQKLIPFLPEGESLPKDPEQLRLTLQSPQFKQALNMFTVAFQSGQLGPLMGQFGLGPEATEAANKGDLEAFGEALQKMTGGDKAKKEDKPGDDEEGMHLD
ncbi:proteasomal ubiquitin receptor ADRM1-B-like isoform X2 [Acanthaster planci]|uniref:Proteasomal ubiquitin receptor ADRM1-B-like isoform X2 n=1 Tax=Acanthaster planci TaxID=133434 RepID=A0A8B7Z768_ACAPL|nr:proteasomal ubiquitin receptor ADRM1-B-like isoform X2 [Acanthaster planci]